MPVDTNAANNEPLRQYLFRIEIDQGLRGHFVECEGLGVRINPIAYREGGANEIIHQLAGTVEYLPVRLRSGVVQGDYDALWAWLTAAVSGVVAKKNVSLIMLDPAGQEKMRWNLLGCWPKEWGGGKLDALGRDVLIHELTLVYEELKRDSQPPAK